MKTLKPTLLVEESKIKKLLSPGVSCSVKVTVDVFEEAGEEKNKFTISINNEAIAYCITKHDDKTEYI